MKSWHDCFVKQAGVHNKIALDLWKFFSILEV